MGNKLRIGLIYGGKSGEHDVSLQTAFAVLKEFDYAKYEVLPFYITKQGKWNKGDYLDSPPESLESLRLDKRNSREQFATAAAIQSVFSKLDDSVGAKPNAEADVYFPLLHGTNGEDGTIQGMFELADVPYVGAGVLASALGMDKVMMKKIFAEAGLPQCKFHYFNRYQWGKDQAFFIMETEVAIGYPCFVKPANLGSSVGVSKAHNRDELIEAVNKAFQYDRKVVVEQFVDAREIEVSVIGNEDPDASVPGEVVSSNDFYDYKAKYVDGTSVMIIPAEIRPEVADEIRELAIKAFQAIDGCGLARVDFFLRKDDEAILLNEINTMPGFTPFSMYPLLWKESGKSYAKLLDELIELALRRYEDKQRIQYHFEL